MGNIGPNRRQVLTSALFTAASLGIPVSRVSAQIKPGTKSSSEGSIGFLKYLEGGYNDQAGLAFEVAAGQLGLKGLTANGKGDANTQIRSFNEMLIRGVTGVGINPVDGINIASLARAAKDANAYLVGSWSVPPWFTPWAANENYTYLTPDDYTGVYKVTEVLAQALNGKGVIVRARGSQGNTTDINRGEAHDRVIKKYPELHIAGELYTNWTPEEGYRVTTSLLTRFPDATAVIAADDHIATGVVAAIKSIGKKPGRDVLVIGANGNDDAVQRVRDGSQLATSSTIPSYIGYAMAAHIYDRVHGWVPESGERMLAWEPIVVTRDNVDKYIAHFLGQLAEKHFDARLMSRVISPNDWKSQVKLYPIDPETQWAGCAKPSGFDYPDGYKSALADGAFDKAAALYAEHAGPNILARDL
ncbi:sugar ABC transporter substrate-binding protein [Rhizobium rhizogenes]|uniref:Periplasmic binding protein/LacI transcriptional regulator n=1 Tax=Rhizobium rhizogenes (strain K84 / ATCC BAA-868) TaxID=311403 RepID=B9JPJ1_RHIR8|nr:periplasmic binding protein/LacI transcriptional regulator [Rhizobium rhizogenes K84]